MQVLIILTDHSFRMDTGRPSLSMDAMITRQDIESLGVKVITAAFGRHANLRELKDFNGGADVLYFQVEDKESCKFAGKDIFHSKCPKNIQKSFQKHAYLELA